MFTSASSFFVYFRSSFPRLLAGCLLLSQASCSEELDGDGQSDQAMGSGGIQAAGGTVGTGGTTASGGTPASGGTLANTGGTATSGGSPATGGNPASGGSPSTGGDPNSATGGSESGPESGGSPNGGGSDTGGAANTGGDGSGGGDSPPGFSPCPADEPCKVLPLGDSITFGLGFDGGYRVELFRLALMDGHDITFTGTQSPNGPAMVEGVSFPRNHEGISGETIQQIANRIPSPGLNEMPHIILVHAGTNDMVQGADGATERLGALMDKLTEEAPDALIAISNIIPLPFASAAVDSFNAPISQMVQERKDEGAHIIFVDQFEGFPEAELGDGVHPNEAGYARMASKWYDAIEGYLP